MNKGLEKFKKKVLTKDEVFKDNHDTRAGKFEYILVDIEEIGPYLVMHNEASGHHIPVASLDKLLSAFHFSTQMKSLLQDDSIREFLELTK